MPLVVQHGIGVVVCFSNHNINVFPWILVCTNKDMFTIMSYLSDFSLYRCIFFGIGFCLASKLST